MNAVIVGRRFEGKVDGVVGRNVNATGAVICSNEENAFSRIRARGDISVDKGCYSQNLFVRFEKAWQK